MRAAKNFSHGRGEHRKDGQPIKHNFKAGDELPDDIAAELDDSFILERVAESDPGSLTRAQLVELAGLNAPKDPVDFDDDDFEDEDEAIEYDEGELREAIGQLATKGDVAEWFETVHPDSGLLDPVKQSRPAMVDIIIEELTGE